MRLFVCAALLLGGCGFSENDAGRQRAGYVYAGVVAHTDPDTGCQYLLYDSAHGGGITPRLTRDGSQLCGPPEADEAS